MLITIMAMRPVPRLRSGRQKPRSTNDPVTVASAMATGAATSMGQPRVTLKMNARIAP